MAIITAPSMADTVYQGPQGNLSVAEGWYQFNGGEKAGDTIELLALPIGMRIYGVNAFGLKIYEVIRSIQVNKTILIPGVNQMSYSFNKYNIIKPFSTKVPGEKLTVTIGSGGPVGVSGLLTISLFYTAVGY
ncbi:TPA: hypothetical protein PXO92_002955 [Yersinia enterocolitica]|nr:hypothetical protein [Yersinia enterocolitica]